VSFGSYQFVRDLEFDAAVQGAIKGTLHGVHAMHFFDCVAEVFRRSQIMMNEDTADDENAVFAFDLAAHVAGKGASAGFYIPRCQRGSKGALQSSRSRGHDVIERGGTGLLDGLWV
jgi:hypothetical protein